MPTIVIRHPDGTVEERDVTGKLTVGCDEGNDLVLRAGGVSQRHAQFFADGGELVLENVGSTAATLVDGEAIGQPTKLRPGVKVLIGEYEVTLKPDQAQLVVRKVGAPTADNTIPDDDAVAPPAPPRRRKLKSWKIAATFAVAAGIAAVVWAAWPSATPAVVEVPVAPTGPGVTGDPCLDLESMLRVARDGANQKALDAANATLACDPLNREAAGLKRAIEAELKGAAAAERGTRLGAEGR